jgi:3-deoxy-D-manno-octulosonic-acid transferase
MGYLLDSVYLVAAVVTAPLWMRKKRGGWGERFGRMSPLDSTEKKRVLLHAVSVGEVNALRPLVPLLEEKYDVVICVTTDTGKQRAEELFGARHSIVRYPLDFTRAVNRFLDAVKPSCVVLVELELWPNFAKGCKRRGIPIGIVNGRLSSRSLRGYLLLKPLLMWTFRRLRFCAVQDAVYAKRFARVGVRKDRISVTGQMKWDIASVEVDQKAVDALATRLGIDRARPLIVAGSTAPGEHQMLHEAIGPDVQLLCAPRRPEWFEHASDELGRCFRYSETQRPILAGDTINRYLLDVIGQLSHAYALADIIFVGRSLVSYHGSDPMEPASLGKAVLIGPHHEDFRVTVETMLKEDALRIVTTENLKSVIRDLLNNKKERGELGQRGRACVESHRGASVRNVACIDEALAEVPAQEKEPVAEIAQEAVVEEDGVRESDLLAAIASRASELPDFVEVGPGDDAAVLKVPRKQMLVTTDQVVEGVHFHSDASVEHIANHALGRALSDIAAMGGAPRACTATAAIRSGWQHAEALFEAMHTQALEWECPLIGGDIASHEGPTVLSVTVLGDRHKSVGPVLRSGAKVGDGVYVTGSVGGAKASDWTAAIASRIKTGQWLCDVLGKALHAMIDVSDGLGIDASRVAQASGVRFELDSATIPCVEGMEWREAMAWGGDYELCFVASGDVPEACAQTSVAITRIGVVSEGDGVVMRTTGGEKIDVSTLGWDHVI